MNNHKDSELTFAKEGAIFWIVSIAKIASWVILAIHLILFVDNIAPLFTGRAQWPSQFSQSIMTLVNVLYLPTLGVFYFLVLQGVAHGLNLGLDLYYDFQPDEEEDNTEDEG